MRDDISAQNGKDGTSAWLTAGDDLSRLLELAESLKERTDASDERVSRIRFMQIMIIATLAVLLVFFRTESFFDSARLFELLPVVAASYFIAFEYAASRSIKKMRPDAAALDEVVALLREAERALAVRNEWSALDRAEFRIRISRFNIEHRNRFTFLRF